MSCKLEQWLSVTAGQHTTQNRRVPGLVLGSGSFGTVYSVQSSDVEVVKVFKDCTGTLSRRKSWWRHEIAAAQALPPHDHILRPIDVALDKWNVQIIYPHCGMDLHNFLKQYGQKNLWDEEQELIIQSLFRGVHHMHSNGLLHTDIKPSNILVEGSCLAKTCGMHSNGSLTPDICSRLVQLQSVMRVRLADLGSVQPAHSDDRITSKHVDPNGFQISTIYYQPQSSFLGIPTSPVRLICGLWVAFSMNS